MLKEKLRHLRHDAKARLIAIWNHCKVKSVCEPDELKVRFPNFISSFCNLQSNNNRRRRGKASSRANLAMEDVGTFTRRCGRTA